MTGQRSPLTLGDGTGNHHLTSSSVQDPKVPAGLRRQHSRRAHPEGIIPGVRAELPDRWAASHQEHVLEHRLEESRRKAARQKETRERRRAGRTQGA